LSIYDDSRQLGDMVCDPFTGFADYKRRQTLSRKYRCTEICRGEFQGVIGGIQGNPV
jgi:hypothetical protein